MIFFKRRLPFNNLKKQVGIGLVLALLVFLILAIFQPFGTYNFKHSSKYFLLVGYGVTITLFYIISHLLMKYLMPKFYQPEHWTIGKELIAFGFTFFIITTATFFFRCWAFNNWNISLYGYFYFFGIAFGSALFPLIIFAVVQFMKADALQQKEESRVEEEKEPERFFLRGNNKKEEVSLLKEELLFLQASDNYVAIHLNKSGKIQKHMIRATLSQLKDQINDPDILSVHRSFIVILSNVQNLSGKSPNYVLSFEGTEDEVPVSRNKIKEVRAHLGPKAL